MEVDRAPRDDDELYPADRKRRCPSGGDSVGTPAAQGEGVAHSGFHLQHPELVLVISAPFELLTRRQHCYIPPATAFFEMV